MKLTVMGPSNYNGPTSHQGKKVQIKVSDRLFIGDFYADIYVFSEEKEEIFKWVDPDGQASRVAAKRLAKSIRWVCEDAISFQTQEGRIELKIGHPWENETIANQS